MIGGAGSRFDEGRPARAECVEKTVVGCRVDPRDLRQLLDVGAPARSIEVGHGVGPEGWKDSLGQTVGGNLGMVSKV